MLDTAPNIFRTPRFALKGGTAIDLFVRNMPRLSVDIDVVYADYRPGRDEAMKEIADELAAGKERLARIGIQASFARTQTGDEVKLLVQRYDAESRVKHFGCRQQLICMAFARALKANPHF